MTPKEALWKRYYDAVRRGNKQEAALVLRQIHSNPQVRRAPSSGCSRCRKKF